VGDIADLIIDGGMCETCGEIFDESSGFPRQCKDCKTEIVKSKHKTKPRVACGKCGKMIAVTGMVQHYNAKHPEASDSK